MDGSRTKLILSKLYLLTASLFFFHQCHYHTYFMLSLLT